MLKKLGAILLATLLAGCASTLSGEYTSGPKGKTMVLSKEVWAFYHEYEAKISSVNRGVFVVGLDNGNAITAYTSYCPGTTCFATNYATHAMTSCRNDAPDLECVLFANSTDILVNYKVEGE
jgi:hypothetical protein